MGTAYQQVKRATLKYISADGYIKKKNVQAIKDVNIPNSFNIPFVRGVVGAFNALISRNMYFYEYDAKGNKRAFPQAQEKVYFPAAQFSSMINRCDSQVRNIIGSMKRILDIRVTRAHEKSGANTFMLSERTIEFLYIFTPEDLDAFMTKYSIEGEDRYAAKQLYNYRVIRPTDKNLNRPQRELFNMFMKNRKHNDFVHYCSTNNLTPEARVIEIEHHMEFLSDKRKEQLEKIKALLKATPGKLKHYFHWLLIKLQQFISFSRNKENIIKKKTKLKTNSTLSQVVNRNKTEGEQRVTEEVAAAHKKDPEDPSLQDVVEIATFWNIMAEGKAMDKINSLTDKKIQSISNLVKSHEKDYTIFAIKNTGNLVKEDNMINLIQFKDFVKDSTDENSRFNKVLNFDKPDTRLSADDNIQRMNKWHMFTSLEVPTFKRAIEAKAWFQSNSTQM